MLQPASAPLKQVPWSFRDPNLPRGWAGTCRTPARNIQFWLNFTLKTGSVCPSNRPNFSARSRSNSPRTRPNSPLEDWSNPGQIAQPPCPILVPQPRPLASLGPSPLPSDCGSRSTHSLNQTQHFKANENSTSKPAKSMLAEAGNAKRLQLGSY